MQDKQADLSRYRMANAKEALEAAEVCCQSNHLRDAVNRAYYAAFYAAKAALAYDKVDFKRHKDVVAYFNREYAATGKVPKIVGRKLGRLQQRREKGDYEDFYIISKEEAEAQIESARMIIEEIEKIL